MDQKDKCGFWVGKDLVISHQHYLFQFSLHHLLMKHCSGEAATRWAQESSSSWADANTGNSRNKQEMLKEVIKDPCEFPDSQFYALGFLQ